MLSSQIANDVLQSALDGGADFAEIFIEKNISSSMSILDSKLHRVQSGVDFGIGVRLIYGTKVLYGYTNTTSPDGLLQLTKKLSLLDKRNPVTTIHALKETPIKDNHPSLAQSNPHRDKKVSYLMSIERKAREKSQLIQQVRVSSLERAQSVEIFNSEGLQAKDKRHYTRVSGLVIVKDGSKQSEGHQSQGGLQNWGFVDKTNPEEMAELMVKQALVGLQTKDCPAGKMPVIIGSNFGGVIFHEACGHLLETTSVAPKTSVFHDKLGQMIANPIVNAVDDGTIPYEWGSINIDDEGFQTQRTQLIKDGCLNSFMVDKVGSLKTGYDRTGSGRRQSYRFAPTSRMRNTFIEPGSSTLEEMIASIDRGIYAKTMGGGSVMPGTGEFNFAVKEGYLIEKGKIQHPVKEVTLIGTGPDILKKISMVGLQLEMQVGMCGSISGAIPVTVGQPPIKVDEILVGGQLS